MGKNCPILSVLSCAGCVGTPRRSRGIDVVVPPCHHTRGLDKIGQFFPIGGLIIITLSVWSMMACDILYPPPGPPPPTAIELDSPELQVIFDQTLDCSDRLDGLYGLNPCERERTARGETAVCTLEPPLAAFRFGCGPRPDTPQEFASISGATPEDTVRFARHVRSVLGPCKPSPNSIYLGEDAPRWEGDHGALACLFTGVLMRYSEDGYNVPFGVFFSYTADPEDNLPFNALTSDPSKLPIQTLRLETELLPPDQKLKALNSFQTLMSAPLN